MQCDVCTDTGPPVLSPIGEDYIVNEWMNEWMNELDTYISPNIKLITRSLSGSHTNKIHSQWAAYLGRAEPGPNAKINCLFSHRHIFGLFLIFQSSFQLHFSLPTFIPRHLRFACWVSVCIWHSLNTNYYGTTFGGVPGSFNFDQIECMCSQNRPQFKVPSERLSNEVQVPCLRGLRTDQQKLCFLLSPTVPAKKA